MNLPFCLEGPAIADDQGGAQSDEILACSETGIFDWELCEVVASSPVDRETNGPGCPGVVVVEKFAC